MKPEASAFDEVIHAPQRLRICAMLSGAQKVEFRVIQTRLDLSKSALSKHLTHLVEVGYVSQERVLKDSRNRLWLSLTPTGRGAYETHVRALRQIVDAPAEEGVTN